MTPRQEDTDSKTSAPMIMKLKGVCRGSRSHLPQSTGLSTQPLAPAFTPMASIPYVFTNRHHETLSVSTQYAGGIWLSGAIQKVMHISYEGLKERNARHLPGGLPFERLTG